MKQALLAVCLLLAASPSWARGPGHFAPAEQFTPPAAHSILGSFRPHEQFTPPAGRGIVSLFRPHEQFTPPAGHGISELHEQFTPPASRGVVSDTNLGPLVKPAWQD